MKRLLICILAISVAAVLVSCSKEKPEVPAVPNNQKAEAVPESKPLETTEESNTPIFENEEFLHSFADALGKNPEQISLEDVNSIHYISLSPQENGEYSLCVADGDATELLFSGDIEGFAGLIKESAIDKSIDFSKELGKFSNIEMIEVLMVPVSDVSFVTNYQNLSVGVFNYCSVTDVSPLASYNPETLAELDFTGNFISDWSPLEHIKEKVKVHFDLNSGIDLTLESYLEQKENPQNDNVNVEQPQFVDENGNPVDFSTLFD